MTTVSIPDLLQRLNRPETMEAYVCARLRGDPEQAPPPIDRYHGIEDYEDLLIALGNEPSLDRQRAAWFWEAIFRAGKDAWDSIDDEVLSRIALVAWRVDCPPDGPDRLDFLPNDSAGFGWGIAERVPAGAHALLWLLVWKARPQSAFWRDNLRVIVRDAVPGDAKDLALMRAIDGAGELDTALWSELIRYALKNPEFPASVLRTALLAHWRLARGNPGAEQHLIQSLGQSLAGARAVSRLPDSWLELQGLLRDWYSLPWTDPAAGQIRVLEKESSELQRSDSGKPRPIFRRESPKRYATRSDPLDMAA